MNSEQTRPGAEEFLKLRGLKDTLYDVESSDSGNPNKWIKGGLSNLLKDYHLSQLQADAEVAMPTNIRDEMDADMEDSGMAQGEIESCLNHWSNKYFIQLQADAELVNKNWLNVLAEYKLEYPTSRLDISSQLLGWLQRNYPILSKESADSLSKLKRENEALREEILKLNNLIIKIQKENTNY